tara:strand:+ start:15311 stop:15778 length:468 start_codon:yes stop_codon:yes gene_type:complete
MNTGEFIKYISTPLTYEEMVLLYKANNINYNKCTLFFDYIITLNCKVYDTFLGDDVINSEKDILSHFLWCFKDVIKDFKEEGIKFEYDEELSDYFYNFYIEVFYNSNNKKDSIEKLNKLAQFSFDYHRIKTRSDMDVLIELYRLFEKSLNFKLKK